MSEFKIEKITLKRSVGEILQDIADGKEPPADGNVLHREFVYPPKSKWWETQEKVKALLRRFKR